MRALRKVSYGLQKQILVSSLTITTRWTSSSSAENQNSSSSSTSGSSSMDFPFPVVQLPARSLWAPQRPLSEKELRNGEYTALIEKVKATRKHYQYPSLCAPQIGWNVCMFTLFDDTVFINPEVVEVNCEVPKEQNGVTEIHLPQDEDRVDSSGPYIAPARKPKDCWAWEPCASCAFLMHYIHRPSTCRIKAFNEHGEPFEVVLDKMRCRFALHEMDHLQGILFTRRIPDTNHVVLLDGFVNMSDWSDDYPSIEARSTFLYNTYTPPYYFEADSVTDANMLDRKFNDSVYPGCELDRKMRIESAAYTEMQRSQWNLLKEKASAEEAYYKAASSTEDSAEAVNDAADGESEEQPAPTSR